MGPLERNPPLIPLCIGLMCLGGTLLFAKGFLLNRIEIYEHQKCSTDEPNVTEPTTLRYAEMEELHTSGNESQNSLSIKTQSSCNQFKRFEKAVVIVIDALRYDFAAYNHGKRGDTTRPYENKLPIIDNLLRTAPQNSLLFRFIADPPTTTMQRLKGLTTGSLPTFIDASKNFGSSEIAEDNWIYQMKSMDKKVIFMGDDTWESLYKKHFHKSFPFPSFNVKDLHTVDNGCIDHLVPEMETNDWGVIIAHFLGVDHCGHRFGPDHPEMTEKLLQMNDVITSVVNRLEDDTVLFVIGDHGMTKTGDHGGDSPEEVNAALFAYSPSQLRDEKMSQHQETVSQIDLVPTLALLMGIPIPFSNLGRLIPDFFTVPNDQKVSRLPAKLETQFSYLQALRSNVRQVRTYIETYHDVTGAFPSVVLSEIGAIYREADMLFQQVANRPQGISNDGNLDSLEKDLRQVEELFTLYLHHVREMCHKIWAQFDDFSINIGVTLLFGMVLTNMLALFQINLWYSHILLSEILFLIIQWRSFLLFTLEAVVVAVITVIVHRVGAVGKKLNYPTLKWQFPEGVIFVAFLCCMHSISLTSNSYIMYESQTISFLTNSLFIYIFLSKCGNVLNLSGSSRKKSKFRYLPPVGINLCLFLTASRLGRLFWSCREEQSWCDVSFFLKPLGSLHSSSSQLANLRYVLSGVSVIGPVYLTKRWMREQGNLGINLMRHGMVTYGLPLAAVSTALYWALQALPSSILDKLPPWQQTFLPRIAYSMILLSFVSILVHPVCANILPKKEGRQISKAAKADEAAKHSQKGKRRRGESKRNEGMPPPRNLPDNSTSSQAGSEESVPVVCGLGTVYSSNLLQFSVTVYLLLALLLGDGMVPSMALMALHMWIVNEVRHLIREGDHEKVPFVPVWLIALWSLMSMQYFFTTGHQATIPSIRFETAFIGYHGDYPPFLYWIPVVLISLNTFASQVMFATALPFTLLWTLTRVSTSGASRVAGMRGEMELQLDADLFRRRLAHLVMNYLCFQALQLLGIMFSAAIHRRHLMAWSIFAPRFIFQGMAFLVTLPALAASCGILLYSHRAISRWIAQHLESPR